jgi:hypothetical protein
MFKKGLKLFKRVLGKYLITSLDDMEAKPHNNMPRIFYYCWKETLDDTFVEKIWRPQYLDPNYPAHDSPEEFIKYMKDIKHWSRYNRSSIIDVWMTEIMEDTFDRDWLNLFMLKMYHEIHDLYDGEVPKPEQYPLYMTQTRNNPLYFAVFNTYPLWHPKEKKKDEMQQKDGSV